MEWRGLGHRPLGVGDDYGIMGILNITPDSFSDGGQCPDALAACARVQELWTAGAHVIDIGAESTRPGAVPVPPEVEQARLLPVLEALATHCPQVVLSVDTRNGDTARLALERGAVIINDVSGLRHDPAMLEILAHYRPGYVLMHSKGEPVTMQTAPHYDDVVVDVQRCFEVGLRKLIRAGLPEDRIALDPGIGFGKTPDHNLRIIQHLPELMRFGRPLVVGVSRKSLFAKILNLPVHARDNATATACALLYERGAQWHRVHDVAVTREALELAWHFGVRHTLKDIS